MKLEQVEHGQKMIVQLICDQEVSEFEAGLGVSLRKHGNLLILKQGDHARIVRGRTRRDVMTMEEMTDRGLPLLYCLLKVVSDGFLLQCNQFVGSHRLPEMSLGLTEGFLAKLSRAGHRMEGGAVAKAVAWMTEEFLVEGGLCFVSGGHEGLDDDPNSFVLHGRHFRAVVGRVSAADTHKTFMAVKRLVRGARGREDWPIMLGKDAPTFCDFTMATQARLALDAALCGLGSNESFLKLWNSYVEVESNKIARRARRIGALRYSRYEVVNRHFAFTLCDEAPASLKVKDTICVLNSEPEWLRSESPITLQTVKLQRGLELGKVTQIGGRRLMVSLRRAPVLSKEGFIALSLNGDQSRIQRREKARVAIQSGLCAMPQLGLLLEDKPLPGRPEEGHHKPLTPDVSQKVFRHGPTVAQEEAIRVALNTPDIALILGPPGTGKTTVIQAIIERLHEMGDQGEISSGRFLLTSFQHDAVANVTERVNILGLPSIKFGTRSGAQMSDLDRQFERVERWAQTRVKSLNKKGFSSSLSRVTNQLEALVKGYLHSNKDAAESSNVLKAASALVGDLTPELSEEALALASHLDDRVLAARSKCLSRRQYLRAVRSLRSTQASHEDDGPERIVVLLKLAYWAVWHGQE